MKTSHFEEGIELNAVATRVSPFHIDFGGEWLVSPTDCAGTGHPLEDGGPYRRLAEVRPSNVLTGLPADADSKPAISLSGSEPMLALKPACRSRGIGPLAAVLADQPALLKLWMDIGFNGPKSVDQVKAQAPKLAVEVVKRLAYTNPASRSSQNAGWSNAPLG